MTTLQIAVVTFLADIKIQAAHIFKKRIVEVQRKVRKWFFTL